MSSFDFINFVKYNNWGNIHLLTTAEEAPFERLTGDVLQRGESPYYTLHPMYYNERAWRMASKVLVKASSGRASGAKKPTASASSPARGSPPSSRAR